MRAKADRPRLRLPVREPSPAADAPATPIPFRNAIQLALQHSGVMGIAAINQWRAEQAYKEVRANYIPQLSIGSALGYSYGFPLTLEGSAPSARQFQRGTVVLQSGAEAVHEGGENRLESHSFDVRDKRDAVILDTALSYAQLAQLTAKIGCDRGADRGRESTVR